MNKIFRDSSRHLLSRDSILKGDKSNIAWEILSDLPIGYGGISVVYKAKSREGAFAAIKIYSPSSRFEMAKTKVYERFMAEIEIYKKLDRHPNILEYYDSGIYYSSPWIALELCSPKTLKDEIKQSRLDKKKAYSIFRLILQGVQHLHKNKVIHRDLKPNNIFISEESIKIGDLGASKILFDYNYEMTHQDDRLGSLLYISPHQRNDPSKANVFDDYYSLGLILYELINKEKLPPGKEPSSHLMSVLINAYQNEFRSNTYNSRCLKDIQLCLDAEDPNLFHYEGVNAKGRHFARERNYKFINKIKEGKQVSGYVYIDPSPKEFGLIYSVFDDEVIMFKMEADSKDWDSWHKHHYDWSLIPDEMSFPLAVKRCRCSDM